MNSGSLPEIAGLGAWTELLEMHDWDEDRAIQAIERFIHAKRPIPVGREREICESLAKHVAMIKMKHATQVGEA